MVVNKVLSCYLRRRNCVDSDTPIIDMQQQQQQPNEKQHSQHQKYPESRRGIKNDKPVWESWKSIPPRNRMIIASSVFVFSAIGLYVSDKLEQKYPAVDAQIAAASKQQQQQPT
ncbi:hypothetical protein E3P99_00722 [Wallemia hederae]|uniref:Uncharacterized protein n=1 Tax=Wallemia hederae TaxID=1540922 RepID=A0A4T0FVF1_9BASI|nr:hypothetical protein E3P99_00722 [Wallemia hederae]